jgi:uncharacterized membrane protein YcaP (DUF421 family)
MAAVIRAVFGYCFLIFIVRIVGRRPGKQISPFEFVFIFFAGGLALTAMVADDASLTNAFCTISTIAVVHFVLAWARQRSQTFARVIDGTPLVLLQNDGWQIDTMRRMRIQDDDVMAMARDKGITSLDQIEYALLERNGEISVIQKSGQTEEEEE